MTEVMEMVRIFRRETTRFVLTESQKSKSAS